MKFVFKPAPNYRCKNTTQRIMFELTLALLVVTGFALYNASTFGSANLMHLIVLLVSSLATAIITEAVYALIIKKNVVSFLSTSFPWVTSLILVLICPMNISVYAMIVCTFMAIVFGKLIFGGFGQNVFNPAAVGRAIVLSSFTASIAADVMTGATPNASMASLGWVCTQETFQAMISEFGGLSNMFIGNYAGALGETSALVIMLCGVYLAFRKVIDWRVPVVYLGTIFLGASVVALVHGMGIYYPLFHVLTGGAMFGAVFMLTDPVTNPTTRVGRIIFAMGAGFFTLIIRLFANFPEGVLFSILIMNMLTPMIDKLLDGHQVKMGKKHVISIAVVALVGFLTIGLGSTSLEAKELPSNDSYTKGATITLGDAASESTATLISNEGNKFVVEAKGFQGNNVYNIVVENGKVSSIEFAEFKDTPGIGDLADNKAFLDSFVGLSSSSDSIDVVSGATFTSKSAASAVNLALGGESAPAPSADKTAIKDGAKAEIVSHDGDVYTVKAAGFNMEDPNEFVITVADGKISKVEFASFKDTAGIGDQANNEEFLSQFVGMSSSEDGFDVVSGATLTSKAVAGAVNAVVADMSGSSEDASAPVEEPKKGNTVLGEAAKNSEASLISTDGDVYVVESTGFTGNKPNVFNITVADGKIAKVEFNAFNDTAGIGDQANNEEFLSSFVGMSSSEDTFDVVSGATFTSSSVASAVNLVLQEISK